MEFPFATSGSLSPTFWSTAFWPRDLGHYFLSSHFFFCETGVKMVATYRLASRMEQDPNCLPLTWPVQRKYSINTESCFDSYPSPSPSLYKVKSNHCSLRSSKSGYLEWGCPHHTDSPKSTDSFLRTRPPLLGSWIPWSLSEPLTGALSCFFLSQTNN